MTFATTIFLILILINSSDSSTFNRVNEVRHYQQPIKEDCHYKGHRLYGRIQIVDSFPDIKVQLVTAFPDLKVKIVDTLPSNCGEWKFVTALPDLKVQFVTSFPDIKIQYVQAFPGVDK